MLFKKYSKRQKNDLNQKWNFSTLLLKVSKLNTEFDGLLGLFYLYNSTSHLVHFDGVSVNERQFLDEALEKNPLAHYGYGLRILSNVLLCATIRSSFYSKAYRHYPKGLKELYEQSIELTNQIHEYNRKLVETIESTTD